MMRSQPLSRDSLALLFKVSPTHPDRLIKREDSNVEFKESYSHGSMAQYFRAIASFANKNGGYIIFGVGDSPRLLKGLTPKSLKQFEELKVEEFTKNLNDYFSPEINWEHVTYEFHDKHFGVIYIHELKDKPAICKKTYDSSDDKYALKEGDVYYRYSGRSQKIRHAEMRQIIEGQRNAEQRLWLKTIAKIAKIGVENAGILDITTGVIEGKAGTVIIDEALLPQIAFIKEGEFVEKEGKPTLKLIGTVQSTKVNTIVLSKEKELIKIKGITDSDIVEAFLSDKKIDEPLDYIRQICHCSSGFYPIYYYIGLANISINEAIQFITKVNVRNPSKRKLHERLVHSKSEYIKLSETNTKASRIKNMVVELFINETIPEDIPEDELLYYIQAVRSLTNEQVINHKEYICEKLLILYKKHYASGSQSLADAFRRAICRLDEAIYFADEEELDEKMVL